MPEPFGALADAGWLRDHIDDRNLEADGRFKSPAELRSRYKRLGASNGAVFYCGSGVNATHHLLAMEIAGIPNARIYAGSWSDWSRRDAPVATGEQP